MYKAFQPCSRQWPRLPQRSISRVAGAQEVSVGHYENFPVASRLVPPRYRSAVVAIYRYARAADDLADEGDAAPGQRLTALREFVGAIDAIALGQTPSQPPF